MTSYRVRTQMSSGAWVTRATAGDYDTACEIASEWENDYETVVEAIVLDSNVVEISPAEPFTYHSEYRAVVWGMGGSEMQHRKGFDMNGAYETLDLIRYLDDMDCQEGFNTRYIVNCGKNGYSICFTAGEALEVAQAIAEVPGKPRHLFIYQVKKVEPHTYETTTVYECLTKEGE